MKKLLMLALPFIMFSCSSDDDNPVTPPVTLPAADSYSYMRGTMGATPFDYTYNLNDATSPIAYGATVSISQLGFERWFSYGGEFAPSIMSDKHLYVSFENIYSGSYENETLQFHTAFATIPTNYVTYDQAEGQHLKGVTVGYQAAENVYYYSNGGSQSGSTFTVTNSSEGTEGGLKTKTIVGTFSCKLYNEADVSDVLTINNGTFKVVVREDF
jgi:hypothetical protein